MWKKCMSLVLYVIKKSKYVNSYIVIFGKKKYFKNTKYLKYVFILRSSLKCNPYKKEKYWIGKQINELEQLK